MAGPASIGFLDLLERVRATLPSGPAVYLVGGAVRDILLARGTHDLDFALSGDVMATGKRVANALGAAFYPLDEERDTARVILIQSDGSRQVLDFAALRGENLENDLRERDFTINAMAIPVDNPEKLVDPLGGAADLRAGLLRACSETSFEDDPLRILRGVRQATGFGFRIIPETVQKMRLAASLLPRVSAERLRDEIFRMLDGPQPAAAIRVLDVLGVLPYILPELPALKEVTQSPPHVADVWRHSLDAVQRLGDLLDVMDLQHNPENAANWPMGLVSVQLGRYREQLHHHLQNQLNPDRSLRALLLFAALYHDIGKPRTRQVEEDRRIRFLQHEIVGRKMISERAHRMRLSNNEIERIKTVVKNHLRPILLAQSGNLPTRRAIYRFFRDTGPAGVDICLLSMADVLATYGAGLPQEIWINHLNIVRTLLEAWWEQPEERVAPPALVNGRDLVDLFDLEPGPYIGQLLEAIREAQAIGEVQTREEALSLVRKIGLQPPDDSIVS